MGQEAYYGGQQHHGHYDSEHYDSHYDSQYDSHYDSYYDTGQYDSEGNYIGEGAHDGYYDTGQDSYLEQSQVSTVGQTGETMQGADGQAVDRKDFLASI